MMVDMNCRNVRARIKPESLLPTFPFVMIPEASTTSCMIPGKSY